MPPVDNLIIVSMRIGSFVRRVCNPLNVIRVRFVYLFWTLPLILWSSLGNSISKKLIYLFYFFYYVTKNIIKIFRCKMYKYRSLLQLRRINYKWIFHRVSSVVVANDENATYCPAQIYYYVMSLYIIVYSIELHSSCHSSYRMPYYNAR